MKTGEKHTRERLIEAAVRRFYRDGFRSVGIDQVLGDVGISKTAFYKHFESKEDLMLAALEEQTRWLEDNFRRMVERRGGPTPTGQLWALFDIVEQVLDNEDFHGCIFVNATIEFPLPHEPAHQAAARSKQAIEDFVCEIAERGKVADARGIARELCLIIEGAYVTRHVTGNRQTIDIARSVADLVIAKHLPR